MSRNAFLKLAVALAIGCGFMQAHAEDMSSLSATNALTLDAAIQIALAQNPELRASSGRVEAAAGRAYQAKLWSNPELELNVEEWPIHSGRGFPDSKQTIGVAQEFPFPGKKSIDRRIGDFGVRLSEAELSLRRVELVRDVKAGFFQVLAAERLIEAAGDLVKLAESSADTARRRVEAGATSDQEQLRAEIQSEQAKADLVEFRRELGTARQTLATLLGRPELLDARLSGTLAESANAALLDQGPERWLAAHPSSVGARTARDRAELELRRARLEPFPDVKAGVAGGRLGDTDESIVELRFSLPLPLIDRAKGKKQEARANVAVAEAELTSIEQRLLREWRTASQRYRAAVEQVTNYRERILPKAEKALELVRGGFEQGKFGFIDLLDTQRTTAEARLAYQQKLLELNIAQAELEALLANTPREAIPSRPK
jgi:cobalt-zinc-cadmium efflux system outer membrane protein